MKSKKRLLPAALVLLLLCQSCGVKPNSTPTPESGSDLFKAGTYTATVEARNGDLTVEVVFTADKISSVEVTAHSETDGIADPAIEQLPSTIVDRQSTQIDAVSGATITSDAILAAVNDCITQAGADPAKLTAQEGTAVAKNLTAGTYTATAHGHHSDITVEMTVSADAIQTVEVTESGDNINIGSVPIERIPAGIVEHQSLLVDAVTGATFTSRAILNAAAECVRQAGGDEGVKAFSTPIVKPVVTKTDVTEDYDVVVVGSGLAGMCAAVAAQQEGASVLVVEKLAYWGGISQTSAGALKYPSDGDLTENGDYYQYLHYKNVGLMQDNAAKVNGYPDADAVKFLVKESNTMVDWFTDMGVGVIQAGTYPDDNGRYDIGFIQFFDGIHFEPDNCAAGIGTMVDYFKANGGKLYLETPAVDLITDVSGAVVGVKAESPEHNYTLNAKAVILCCGGFGSDPELLAEMAPAYAGETVGATGVGNTGDGIRMAMKVGADIYKDGYLMGGTGHTFVTDSERIQPFSDNTTPKSSLYVNPMGQRVNSEDPVSYTPAITYVNPDAEDYYWAIMNEEIANTEYAEGHKYIDLVNEALAEGKDGVFKEDDIEQLAKDINIIPTTLMYTLSHYNNLCEKGEDTDLFKNAKYLIPMYEGPWYAVKADMEFFGTVGGVKTNVEGAVLKADGTAIPGLYAAGEMSNHKVLNMSYSGGVSVSENVVFGRSSGEQAAKAALGK